MNNLPMNNKAQARSEAFVPQGIECIIDMLMGRLKAIYPAWSTSIKTQQDYLTAKLVWTEGLKANGVTTGEQIRRGLSVAMQQDTPFLPSVGMFAKWCNEPTLAKLRAPTFTEFKQQLTTFMSKAGSTFEDKYREYKALHGDFKTDVEYWLMFDGYFAMKESTNNELAGKLSRVYENLINKLKNKEQIPPRRVLIEEKELVISDEARVEGSKILREMLNSLRARKR